MVSYKKNRVKGFLSFHGSVARMIEKWQTNLEGKGVIKG